MELSMGQVNKKTRWCSPRGRWGALATLLLLFMHSPAFGAEASLEVKVIHATRSGLGVDPELKPLVADFAKLKFTSYKVLDRASIKLGPKSTSRFQLPNGVWVEVNPIELSEKGVWRVRIEAPRLKFKSVVAINPGGTVAVGGPSYKSGALIFALTRGGKP